MQQRLNAPNSLECDVGTTGKQWHLHLHMVLVEQRLDVLLQLSGVPVRAARGVHRVVPHLSRAHVAIGNLNDRNVLLAQCSYTDCSIGLWAVGAQGQISGCQQMSLSVLEGMRTTSFHCALLEARRPSNSFSCPRQLCSCSPPE